MNSGASAFKISLLSLGTLAASVLSSVAQVVPDPIANDIFLGFRIAGQPDGYLVRLGNYTSYFRNVAEGTTVSIPVNGINADLTAKFGASWSTNTNAYWGIFGSSLAGEGPLLFASRERVTPSNASEAWPTMTQAKRNIVGGSVAAVIQNIGGYRSRQATANNPVGTFQPAPDASGNGNESNYIYQTTPNIDFSSESGWSIEGNFALGASSTVLDLYRVGSESTLRVGYFTITSAGVVSFTRQTVVTPPANADTDGDGVSDALEDIAGTSKTNPSDFFRVQSATIVGGFPSLSFTPAANRTYKLYYSETLLTGSWIEITSAAPSPPTTIARYVTGGSPPSNFAFGDSDPVRRAKNKGFYKVEVSLNP